MASSSKIMKLSSGRGHGHTVQLVRPTIYETANSITHFAHLFPNVFEEYPNHTCEEQFNILKQLPGAIHRGRSISRQIICSVSAKGNDMAPKLDIAILMQPELLPDDNGAIETDRIIIAWSAWHYKTDVNLAIMSLSVVDETGRRSFIPEFKTFKRQIGDGDDAQLAYGLEWKYRLADFWKNKVVLFPDGTLRVKLQVGRDFSQEHVALPRSVNTLTNNMLELLESGDRSDFTIKCGSEEFRVHEVILARRSPVFDAMLSSDMMEKKKREVPVTDVEPDTLQLLLQFVYASLVEPERLEFEKLCDLTRAADKYQLMELKDICFNFIIKNMNLDNIGDISLLAYDHSASKEIQTKISDFVAENYKSLRKISQFKGVMKKCVDMFFDD